MRTYHVLYYEDDMITRGENFRAGSPCDALLEFYSSHPKATFVILQDTEALSWVHINRGEIQQRADDDEKR